MQLGVIGLGRIGANSTGGPARCASPKTANFLARHPRHNYCLAATLYLPGAQRCAV